MGGKRHVHDCDLSRSIGYFIEPLIILGLFGKKPLTIRLKGLLVYLLDGAYIIIVDQFMLVIASVKCKQ